MAATKEIEMCLSLAPEQAAQFCARVPALLHISQPAHTVDLASYYYDTPAGDLANQRAGLRLRYTGKAWVQTLKYAQQEHNGVVHRVEIEHTTQGQALELTAIGDATMRNWLQGLGAGLQPVFSTHMQRTLWLVSHQGSVLELALDIGSVQCGKQQEAIHEIEIELKQGDAQAVEQVAQVLRTEFDLPLQMRSKAERGYRLVQALAAPQGT